MSDTSHIPEASPPPPRPIERIVLPLGTHPRVAAHLRDWLEGAGMLRAYGQADRQYWFEVRTQSDDQARLFLSAWAEIQRIARPSPSARN